MRTYIVYTFIHLYSLWFNINRFDPQSEVDGLSNVGRLAYIVHVLENASSCNQTSELRLVRMEHTADVNSLPPINGML